MSFVTPLAARTISQPSKFGGDVFFTPGRLSTLVTLLGERDADGMVDTADPRVDYEWNTRAIGTSNSYEPLGPINPWHIPSHYVDEELADEQVEIVNADSNAAVDLALKYLVTRDREALAGAIRILDAWSRITEFTDTNDSPLVWANRWPKFIQAALMLRGTDLYTAELHTRLQAVTASGLAISPAYNTTNNWASWGCVLEIASAEFLGEYGRFTKAIRRWRALFDGGVVNNVPIHEVYREDGSQGNGKTGLWYSNFLLDAMTIGAEWARFGGEWLYDYTGFDGSTFKGLYENVRYWTRYPNLFPYNTSGTPSTTTRIMAHDDILHALWPHPESQWLLDNFPNGSPRDVYGMRQFVLAYRYRPLYG